MADIAFLGLGQMGLPMARNLVGAGHSLTVWNRTSEKARELGDIRVARTPAEAAVEAEAVVTMLATPDAVREVVLGPNGVAGALHRGSTLIEMSTIGPAVVREVREALPDGVAMIDAPVQGSVPQATDGSLRIWVGGSDEDVARWWSMLGAMGEPTHVGPLGSGAALKLVMNSTLGVTVTALGEALALGLGLGLSVDVLLAALEHSPVGAQVKSKGSYVARGEFPPSFKLSLARKDLTLVTDAADEAGVEVRVAMAAKRWIEDADDADLGGLDYSAVAAFIAGLPAGLPPERD